MQHSQIEPTLIRRHHFSGQMQWDYTQRWCCLANDEIHLSLAWKNRKNRRRRICTFIFERPLKRVCVCARSHRERAQMMYI